MSVPYPRVPILGTLVTVMSFEDAIARLEELVSAHRAARICNANVFAVMLAFDDPEQRRRVNAADCVIADGMPIVWLLRRMGFQAERIHGDDYMLECCRRHPEWRHFLVGGAQGQVEAVAGGLRRRFPGIQIVGHHATPVRPVPQPASEAIISAIQHTRADVVWVGMGSPAQDVWMEEQAYKAKIPMVGVGSAFDLLSGRTREAPSWIKKSGFQWLFRMMQEPRRLAGRYFYYNPRFVWHVIPSMLRGRRPQESSQEST